MRQVPTLEIASSQAKLLSVEAGIAYIHKFSDGYIVSVAKGSDKYIVATYIKGKLA
jgi:hypothetical protein